ncbi:DsbA family protein [Rickettsia endosymbiont of Gonocerus acuteangulatus]|uniref:DsbA family protein n=1 Tax=Rickettsia endosymbiont of Gonocerus acuteangulatus TaxID=3066266 RepID=UPI003132C5F4
MRNSFITLIFLLLLSGCSEEKEKVVEQESSKSIAPAQTSASDENNNQTTEVTTPAVITPAVQEQIEQKPEVKTFKVTFKIDENDMVLGNKDSKIVVVEYFSPTCPHCAYYHSTIFPELKQKYIDTNKIAYVTREFIATKQDLDASILARCKGYINSFMLFHDIMLKQQDKWSVSNKYRELLTDIGQLGGVTPEEYKKCLSDDKITETLIANTNFITKAPKFIGTPSFFVNGVQTENYSMNSISAAIDKAIEESKNKIDL